MHSEQTTEQYLARHHLPVYLTDLLRLLGRSAAADACRLASSYLCAVAHGQHVQGREFSYVSATPLNRMTFILTAKALLEPVASHTGAFTLQDVHSLMLMLCSDIPLRVTRSAFKAASPLLPSGSVVPHLSGDVAKLGFPRLWSSLEVTFLFEHHLLELRHIAFEGKSHLLKGLEDVQACLEVVQATVCLSGWPSIPEAVLQVVIAQLAEHSDQGGQRFHFDALVRGLCNSSELREHLTAKMSALNDKQASASARLASLLKEQPFQDKTNIPIRLAWIPSCVWLTRSNALN
ncbi:hypothetical protein ABBQ38_014454 [Trebouxia sp. C0009 RCD-2024]